MPSIMIRLPRLRRFLGFEIEAGTLAELLPSLGMAVEEMGADYVRAEYNPNRPDYSSHAGVARALLGVMGKRLGSPRYSTRRSGITIRVDRSVKRVRPLIASALIRGVELTRDDIEELIDVQEDLDWVLGRDRRKVAIGLHDYSRVRPPLLYRALGLDSVRFVPLRGSREMTPREILAETETGRRYAQALPQVGLAPLIFDGEGRVISFPPIINSALTELREGTRDVFIDVTGTERRAIWGALSILSSVLADMGGRIYSVRIVDGDRSYETPEMGNREWRADLHEVSRLIGVEVGVKEAVKALGRMRLTARSLRGGRLSIEVPAYRVDIMHPVDFAEELAMGLGYDALQPELPSTLTFGSLTRETRLSRALGEVMIGLGFTEAVNPTLSNKKKEYAALGLSEGDAAEIVNPASAEYDTLRRRLLPGLLESLSANRHNPYPQRLFEVGDVIERDDSAPELFTRRVHLGCVISHSAASFSEIKSIYDELCRILPLDASPSQLDYPYLIPGRSGRVTHRGAEVGFIGEVHPRVLEAFGLSMPTAAMEIDVSALGL